MCIYVIVLILRCNTHPHLTFGILSSCLPNKILKKKKNSTLFTNIMFVSLRNQGDRDDYCQNLQSNTHTIYMAKSIYIIATCLTLLYFRTTLNLDFRKYTKSQMGVSCHIDGSFDILSKKTAFPNLIFRYVSCKIKQLCRNMNFLHNIMVI